MENENEELPSRIITTRLAQKKYYSQNREYYKDYQRPVSYTHLTLPTNREV